VYLNTIDDAPGMVDAVYPDATSAAAVAVTESVVKSKEPVWLLVEGFEAITASTVTESPVANAVNELLTLTVAVSPTFAVPVAACAVSKASVCDCTTAFDGPDARTPRPTDATTASAIRLKLVLLDICFLSIVVTRTIPVAALR
jgi:hypothetical protein